MKLYRPCAVACSTIIWVPAFGFSSHLFVRNQPYHIVKEAFHTHLESQLNFLLKSLEHPDALFHIIEEKSTLHLFVVAKSLMTNE